MKKIQVITTLASTTSEELEEQIKRFMRLFRDKSPEIGKRLPYCYPSNIFKAEMVYYVEVDNLGEIRE